MNDTARLHPEVAEFAAAVRSELSDLNADEVEELTGDLEADLQERLDETGAGLGDASEYATELRTAAGLPPRDRDGSAPWYRTFGSAVTRRVARLEDRLRAAPASSALLNFLVALRSVWWIIRAWVAYQIAHLFFSPDSPGDVLPHSLRGWLVLLAATVVSVQWGRGQWRDRRFVPVVVVVGSIAAVIGLPVAYDHASAVQMVSQVRPVMQEPDKGLRMNGRPVRNVFAYDATGNPLGDVQLYDQQGKPLSVTHRSTWKWVSVPATLQSGQQAWNVFPLARVPWRDSTFDRAAGHRVAEPGAVPQVWDEPLPHAPAVLTTETDRNGNDEDEPKQDGDPTPDEQQPDDERKPGDDPSPGQN